MSVDSKVVSILKPQLWPSGQMYKLLHGSELLDAPEDSLEELAGSTDELAGAVAELVGTTHLIEELVGFKEKLVGFAEELTGSQEELVGFTEELTGSLEELVEFTEEFVASLEELCVGVTIELKISSTLYEDELLGMSTTTWFEEDVLGLDEADWLEDEISWLEEDLSKRMLFESEEFSVGSTGSPIGPPQAIKEELAVIPIRAASPVFVAAFHLESLEIFFFSIFIIAPKQCFKNMFYSNKIFEKNFFCKKR